MRTLGNSVKIKSAVHLALALFVILEAPNFARGNIFYALTMEATTSVSLSLALQNITNSYIYTGNTSAIVTVPSGTANLDVLGILNQTSESWQLQLIAYADDSITRLTNCTIWIHNESTTSVQISIIDGAYNQLVGDYYTFIGGGADKIAITASTNATGTSYVYTYLKVLKPGTSTYSYYVITFEVA